MAKFILVLAGAVLGGFIMLQRRVTPQRVVNPVTPHQSLVDLRTQLELEQNRLKAEISQAVTERNRIENQLKQTRVESKLKEQLDQLEAAIGLKSLTDNGVVVTLDDSKKGQLTQEKIVQAADLRDVVNVAYLAAAQAVSINGLRFTMASSIDGVANTILVNNQRVSNPFVIKIVGDVPQLTSQLKSNPLLADLNRRSSSDGLLYHIEESESVEVEPYEGSLKPQVMKRSDGR